MVPCSTAKSLADATENDAIMTVSSAADEKYELVLGVVHGCLTQFFISIFINVLVNANSD
jgi:hypothetical protein